MAKPIKETPVLKGNEPSLATYRSSLQIPAGAWLLD